MATKSALRAELLSVLQAALTTAQRAHAAAVEGATSDEARPENDKDTRGLEQSYLARGQAQRVAELEVAVAEIAALTLRTFTDEGPIALGALVTLDEEGRTRHVLVAPHGGGTLLAGGVQVVTPSSPLGKALIGKRIGDEIELRLPGNMRDLIVEAIR